MKGTLGSFVQLIELFKPGVAWEQDGIRTKEVFAKVVEDATRAFAEHGSKRKDRRRESGRWEAKGVA